MNCLEGIIEDLDASNFDYLSKTIKPLEDASKTVENYAKKVLDLFHAYLETGVLPPVESIEAWEDCIPNAENHKIGSMKENIEPNVPVSTTKFRGRPRRNATRETANTTVTSRIKQEKLSILEANKLNEPQLDLTDIKVKVELMQAPTKPAPRRKKQTRKLKVKQEKIDEEIDSPERQSDVIVQEKNVSVITLDDSSDETNKTITNRSETKAVKESQKTKKRSRTNSSEGNHSSSEKRVKSLDENDDATSLVDETASITNKTTHNLNTTVVVENSKLTKTLIPNIIDDLMTDDESEEEIKPKKATRLVRGIPKPTKQIFSPFEQSPVKKKVEAFEKLNEEASAIPPRLTRTKTRAIAKDQKQLEENTELEVKVATNVKEKTKIFTPVTSKCLPLASSTSIKTNRVLSSSNESNLSVKSVSALKASQAEYREREKKRREKEQDALKKRDALLQARIEEQKKKREEKQLKAQQQREALEKEKLKALEAQKIKEERHKQLIAEQEEKKLKQKEEQERKRLLAKMKAIEEKKKEEERKKREEEKRREEERKARHLQKDRSGEPKYMIVKAPLLPTDDCYDSDDDNYGNSTFVAKDWVNTSQLKYFQRCALAAGESIKNTFFSIQAQTPDLRDIFENIDVRKLKRSSSAVWHKPPRFSMMPGLESFTEDDETQD